MKIVLSPALLVLAGACVAAPPADGGAAPAGEGAPAPAAGAGECDAGPARTLVGRKRSAGLGTEAQRLSGAASLRWIEPDSMVTMDYRADRLNIEVDSSGKVTALRCG
jgi:hypothetical protein